MFLPNDVCRCLDHSCGVRFTCGRYFPNVDKGRDDDQVVVSPTLKDEECDDPDLPCDYYIESGLVIEVDDEERKELLDE